MGIRYWMVFLVLNLNIYMLNILIYMFYYRNIFKKWLFKSIVKIILNLDCG